MEKYILIYKVVSGLGSKLKKIIAKGIAFTLIIFCFMLCNASIYASDTDTFDYDDISSEIEKDIEKYHIPGMAVIVVDKENVLFSGTYGNCDSIDTPFIIGSMSKSFTELSIMQLVEEGLIDLDTPISEYMDASEWFIDEKDCDRIMIRNLLNQTSGITTYQTFGNLSSTSSYGSHVYANANYGLLGLSTRPDSKEKYALHLEVPAMSPHQIESDCCPKCKKLIVDTADYENNLG